MGVSNSPDHQTSIIRLCVRAAAAKNLVFAGISQNISFSVKIEKLVFETEPHLGYCFQGIFWALDTYCLHFVEKKWEGEILVLKEKSKVCGVICQIHYGYARGCFTVKWSKGLLFRPKSGSVPKMPHTDPPGPKKVLDRAFGYGDFEYFVRMSIAPRIGVLLPRIGQNHPSDNSPFRDRIPERSPDSNSPQNLGLTRQNLGSVGIFTPR